MGVLKARVDGTWVPIGVTAPEEVVVGPSDPGPGVELWYDTDDPAPKVNGLVPIGGSSGQVLVKKSGSDFDTEWAASPMRPIAQVTLSAPGQISFPAIPQTFRHLQIVATLRSTRALGSTGYGLKINDDVSANYGIQSLSGGGAVASASSQLLTFVAMGSCPGATAAAGYAAACTIDIPDYRGPFFRHVLGRNGTRDGAVVDQMNNVYGVWRSVAAITKLDIVEGANVNWETGSTATLFAGGA